MIEDENIEFITEELIEDIELIEYATESIMEEVVVEVDVEEEDPVEIIVTEAADPTGVRITSDHSPYLPDQHTVGAITGLTERLEKLERFEHPDTAPLPEPVEAVETNQANYYLWDDENPNAENRDGYFVSIHQKQDVNKIYICNSSEDEFGVTVSAAGFIGNQSTNTRGSNYGLVVHSGVVAVKCESDVGIGDYVVSNKFGQAKKTDGTYGYLVTAISNIDGVEYAIISLTTPTTQMQRFSEITKDVADRMDSSETNIATAISVANAAYNKAQVAHDWVQGNVENIAGDVVIIGGKVDEVVTDIDGLKDSVANSTVQSDKAYDIATKAQQYASDTKMQVEAELNDAHTTINNLTGAVSPITAWVGYDENGAEVEGASYFIQHIDKNFLETKTQIETVQTLTEENQTAISQNAENIQLLATSIDEYSVGEWSQAYGLTLSQAWSILNPGMIYIPTPVTHYEKYVYEIVDIWDEQGKDTSMIYKEKDTGLYWRSIIQKDENDNLANQWESIGLTTTDDVVFIIDDTQAFTRGYYYTWNGFYWVESESPYVYFSAAYVNPSKECQYWYRDTNEDLKYDDITYKAHGLYMIINDKWTEVNILDGNITNRVASMINQTANSISLDVSNARGDIADLKLEVGAQGSQIAMVAANSEPSDIELTGSVESFDLLPADAQDGVYYAVKQTVYRYNGTEWKEQYHLTYDGVYVKKINAANIIAAVNNEGDSSIGINADKIIMTGTTTFLKPYDVGPNGSTTIDGSRITTGTIHSNDKSIYIDLGNNTVAISGKITATSGFIGDGKNGFAIQSTYISNVQDTYNGGETPSKAPGVYLGVDGIGLGNGSFYVDNLGNVSASGNLDLGGSINMNGQIVMGGNITLGGNITFADDGNITWSSTSNPVKALYHSGKISSGSSVSTPNKPDANESYGGSASYSWHTTFQESADSSKGLYPDYYVSYTYDGGITWTAPIQIRGKDGATGPQGDSGVTEVDVEEMMQEIYGITSTEITSGSIGTPYIYSPNINGGTITGGIFRSTGTKHNDSAYYIYNGNTLAGYIRYDKDGIAELIKEYAQGEGTITVGDKVYQLPLSDATERVWFATEEGVAMKLHSGGNMSLCAGISDDYAVGDGTIYFMSKVHFAQPVSGLTVTGASTAVFG